MGFGDFMNDLNRWAFGGNESSSKTRSFIDPAQKEQLERLYSDAGNLYGQGQLSQIAPFSPAQQMGQRNALNFASNFNAQPFNQALGQGLNNSLLGLGNMSSPMAFGALGRNLGAQGGPQYNPMTSGALNTMLSGMPDQNVLQSTIQRALDPVTENFTQRVLPSIKAQNLFQSGVPTSRRGVATQRALQDFNQTTGNIATDLTNQALTRARGQLGEGVGLSLNQGQIGEQARQFNLGQQLNAAGLTGDFLSGGLGASQNAIGLGQDVANLNMLPSQIQQQIGAQQQQLQQRLLDQPYQNITRFQGLLGDPTKLSQSESYGTSAEGGFMDALAMYMMGGSDRRIKEDISYLGHIDDIPMYSFKYKGFEGRHIGTMAQDIEADHPDAVVEMNGIKFVNYAKLGVPYGRTV